MYKVFHCDLTIALTNPFGLAREAIQNTKSSFMDILHTGLDLAGMIPGVGIVADAVNAVSYLAEGNTEYALLSGLAAIPIIGDAKTAIKYAGGVAESGIKGYNRGKVLKSGNEVIDNMHAQLSNHYMLPPSKRGLAPISKIDGKVISMSLVLTYQLTMCLILSL